MKLSPGEQPQHNRPSARRIALALALCAIPIALLFTQRERLKEYQLYLTQDRKAIAFRFDELSEQWTEQTVRERFAGLPIDCFPNDGRYLDERVCMVDVKSHNDVPAMFVSFFFAAKRLNRTSINIPWWAHRQAYGSLLATLGEPATSQILPRNGVRLHGWHLSGGAALFFNRDKPINPLEWNAIFWNSASACRSGGCFAPR
jgi:hypothetical protein